jgi:hypothetical protein
MIENSYKNLDELYHSPHAPLKRAEQVLLGSKEGGQERESMGRDGEQGGEMAQTMYAHMNK